MNCVNSTAPSYDLPRVAPNLEIRVNGGTARKIKAIGEIGQMSGIIRTKIKRSW